jgi:hypothetical protein
MTRGKRTISDDNLTGVCAATVKFPIGGPMTFLNQLSPYMRVATAVLPFAVAVAMRLLLGGNALTRWLVTLSTVWFAANILMAPYSSGMRQDIRNLLH